MATSPSERGPLRMTYQQFLDWADEDTLAEWVDGEVEWMHREGAADAEGNMPSPASTRHQEIVAFLLRMLAGYAEWQRLGVVLVAPFQMKLGHSGREPDLLFVAAAHLERLRPTYLDGPADLVVEVLSPESAHRDRVTKLAEYQDAGIPEYWLVDPDAATITGFHRGEQRHYQPTVPDAQGQLHAVVLPGFWLDPAWLRQQPLPEPQDALLAVGGVSYARHLLERLQSHLPPGDVTGSGS